jgi:hypothetical protein
VARTKAQEFRFDPMTLAARLNDRPNECFHSQISARVAHCNWLKPANVGVRNTKWQTVKVYLSKAFNLRPFHLISWDSAWASTPTVDLAKGNHGRNDHITIHAPENEDTRFILHPPLFQCPTLSKRFFDRLKTISKEYVY